MRTIIEWDVIMVKSLWTDYAYSFYQSCLLWDNHTLTDEKVPNNGKGGKDWSTNNIVKCSISPR